MNVAIDTQKLPPMLTQYLEYKRQYPDCQVFFQVGDFYELFFEDAVTVSRVLNLTLTTRDKNDPDPVPMCGVPIAVIDNYLERLVQRGFSVAIISQVGEPTGKGMVARKLERIITPGVRVLGRAEDDGAVAIVGTCYVESDEDIALAFTDVQSGRIAVREGLNQHNLMPEVQRVGAAEIIVPRSVRGKAVDRRNTWVRDIERAQGEHGLKYRPESYVENTKTSVRNFSSIPGYASLSVCAKKAVRLLLAYLDETTIDRQLSFSEISPKAYSRALLIDATTRRHLELVANTRDGGEEGTLLQHLKRTVTPGGARLLRAWILAPLSDSGAIGARQDVVDFFAERQTLRDALRATLKFVADAERIAARIELDVASPRELGALRDTLKNAPRIAELLRTEGAAELVLAADVLARLEVPPQPLQELERTLSDNPPLSVQDGGVVRDGFDTELDRLRRLKAEGKSWIVELEASEKTRTGISSLKIRYNNVLGYFIEVTRANVDKVPSNYMRRQSTVNAERFTTTELREREEEVLGAEGRSLALEKTHFEALRSAIKPYLSALRLCAGALAELDILVAFAELKVACAYVRPSVDDSGEYVVVDGKHPVLAQRLEHAYVPNSLHMGRRDKRCLVITGPNMGGKSTYIRQAGLIAIMAHCGAPVPARSVRMGMVDRIFARIGAADNIAEGDSTFMVEMREASNILSAASERSLLLIDEIGRGTATSDGLAIARAILEWVVERVEARTLFATHFHELTDLAESNVLIANLCVGSIDRDGEVYFTHLIEPGAASKSYGIEVAKLAGLPAELISRAREILAQLAETSGAKNKRQLGLFQNVASRPAEIKVPADYEVLKALNKRIQDIDVDGLSPREALDLVYALKAAAKST
ncbi:MAG: DNA mismatch repair protein MutS [Oligoflexia bacterium]|nr:DNA mismatch repair protein MutS [Oligoflexia bacterium]